MFTHLYQHDCFTEDAVRFYIGEIILALERLHDVRITIIMRNEISLAGRTCQIYLR